MDFFFFFLVFDFGGPWSGSKAKTHFIFPIASKAFGAF
jgi:hypothetical protein